MGCNLVVTLVRSRRSAKQSIEEKWFMLKYSIAER